MRQLCSGLLVIVGLFHTFTAYAGCSTNAPVSNSMITCSGTLVTPILSQTDSTNVTIIFDDSSSALLDNTNQLTLVLIESSSRIINNGHLTFGGNAATGTSRGSLLLGNQTNNIMLNTQQGILSTTGTFNDAMAADGPDNQLINEGIITTTGASSFGMTAGRAQSSGQLNSQLYNIGSIATSGNTARGMSILGSNGLINNQGTILTTGNNSYGVFLQGNLGTIMNSGIIETRGSGAAAVFSNTVGSAFNTTIENQFDGKIISQQDIAIRMLNGTNTVINAGLLYSGIGNAVVMGSASNTMILRMGSRIVGSVDAGGNVASQLLLQETGVANNAFLGFGEMRMQGSDWRWLGEGSFNTIILERGHLTLSGHLGGNMFIQNTATLMGNGGVLTGNIENYGTFESGFFAIAGDYIAHDGGTTILGLNEPDDSLSSATFNINGTYTQAHGSLLNVTLNAPTNIVARRAQLGGLLVINGFSDDHQPIRTSDVINGQRYQLITTTEGILGNFDIPSPLTPTSLDYLPHTGFISNNNYLLDFKFAWTEGGQLNGTGDFTLNKGTAFDVDVILANQAGSFNSGWDGISLTKKGDGLLVLSSDNTYTGGTNINGGTLSVSKNANLGDVKGHVLLNGGALQTTAGFSTNRKIIFGSKGGTIKVTDNPLQINTGITGIGNFTKEGVGKLILTGLGHLITTSYLNQGILELNNGQFTSNIIATSGTQFIMKNAAVFKGFIDPTNVAMSTNSHWLMTDNSTIDSLAISDSTLSFEGINRYNTLTIYQDLIGNGIFNLRSPVRATLFDKIIIGGNVYGEHLIRISDSGYEPDAGTSFNVVENQGLGLGHFTLAGGHVDLGAYRYLLHRSPSGWVLSHSNPSNPDTNESSHDDLSTGSNTVIANQTATRLMVNAQMDTLVKRLGELRMDNDEGGIWSRGFTRDQTIKTNGTRQFEQTVNGLEIGADRAFRINDNQLFIGGFTSLGTSKQDFGENSHSKINSISMGGYMTYATHSGFYIDSVLKYSYFKTKINFVDNIGDRIGAAYNNHALTANLEIGHRLSHESGWFVEPQIELQATQISGQSYSVSNGLNVRTKRISSLQARIGSLIGRNIQFNNDFIIRPYAKLSWFKEHSGTSHLDVNGNRLTSKLPDSWGAISAGLIAQSDKHKFYIDLDYQKGNGLKRSIGANLGYRYVW